MRPSQFPRLLVSAVPQALTQGAVSFAGQCSTPTAVAISAISAAIHGQPAFSTSSCFFNSSRASIKSCSAVGCISGTLCDEAASSIFSRVKGGPAIDRRQAE